MIFSVEVANEEGDPIPNCDVKAIVFSHWEAGEGFGKDRADVNLAVTDNQGKAHFSITSKLSSMNHFPEAPNGYYKSHGGEYLFRKAKNNIWQPENKKFRTILKRIKNPIAMYAKKGSKTVPLRDAGIGYDLEIGDWIAPHGKGKKSDLVFHYHLDQPSDGEITSILKLRFSNKKDGLIPFEAPLFKGSRLRSDHHAPRKGYRDELIHRREVRGGKVIVSHRKKTMNYYLRVRTVLDDDGNIVSAHYGKIYGDFMEFTHYLNPTPNDRNVEFDRKKNLIDTGYRGHKVQDP